MGVNKLFTTGYHPQTNGFVEWLYRTLCKNLAAFVTDELYWDEYLAMDCFRYNSSVLDAIGLIPFEAMFGVKAFDFDTEIGWKSFVKGNDEKSFQEQLNTMHDKILRGGMLAPEKAAKQYENVVKVVLYSERDQALLFYPPGLVETGKKLRSPWTGPYRVVQN